MNTSLHQSMGNLIPSIGIEEEYQLVDPITGVLVPNCKEVMRDLKQSHTEFDGRADIQHELHLNQIEMASDVCKTLDDVHESLVATRTRLNEAAIQNGSALVAAGTHPMQLPNDPAMTPGDRYESMAVRYQQLARELFIFGCHVHVSMPNRKLGSDVMNRCRRWLPLLQALSANSPYWDGQDTGYASYRRELWMQWPVAGPPPHLDSWHQHQDCVRDLIQCGAIADESFVYWDIRLPTKVDTIEFRCADVLTSIDHAVGYAGLVRAIVMQATENALRQRPYLPPRAEVLRYSMWQAARYGVRDELVDPERLDRVSTGALVQRLLDEIDGSLQRTGDREWVESFLNDVVQNGNGADRQRSLVLPLDEPGDLHLLAIQMITETHSIQSKV